MTYAGHPLYRYAGDAAPGDAKGENLDQFGAEWYVLSAQGKKVEPKKGGSKPKKAPTKPGYSY